MDSACKECSTTTDTAQCAACGQWVCPSHRAGLGSASDGYTCTGACLLFGFGGVARTTPPLRREKPDFLKNNVFLMAFLLTLFVFVAATIVWSVLQNPSQ